MFAVLCHANMPRNVVVPASQMSGFAAFLCCCKFNIFGVQTVSWIKQVTKMTNNSGRFSLFHHFLNYNINNNDNW